MHNVKIETELEVITPNEPGILGRVLGTLANSGVNLKALNAYAGKDKGVFYNYSSGVKQKANGTFFPVAWWPLISIVRNNLRE